MIEYHLILGGLKEKTASQNLFPCSQYNRVVLNKADTVDSS